MGAAGGDLALGFPPPEISASTVFIGTKSRIGMSSDFVLVDMKAGPTTKISASSRCAPAEAIKHFFCSRSINAWGVQSVRPFLSHDVDTGPLPLRHPSSVPSR